MYFLCLNLMRGRAEETRILACAETRDALVVFMDRERVEPYRDGQWLKTFRRGGPLEWYNPPFGDQAIIEMSLEREIAKLTESWFQLLSTTPHV